MGDIRPALTPEQWKAQRIDFPPSEAVYCNDFDEAVVRHDDGDVVWKYVWEGCDRGHTLQPSHGIAALLLHGQPFGFTHDDLAAIDEGICGIYGRCLEMCSGGCSCSTDVDRLRSLALRIAALLPPADARG